MGTPQFNTGPFNPDIDHPLQIGWNHAGVNALESGALHSVLNERYSDHNSEQMNRLGRAVIAASHSVDAYREAHERANLPKLQLNKSELKEYASLTGSEAGIIGQITWFERVAVRAFERTNTALARQPSSVDPNEKYEINREKDRLRVLFGGKFGKIALEVAGKRQFGDWESTRKLDDAVRKLRDHFNVRLYDEPEQQKRRYKIEGRIHFDSKQPFDHLIIRRRRIVADIRGVELFKESSGLIVWQELSEDDQEYILRRIDLSDVDPAHHEEERYKIWADRIGDIFEMAIKEKETTRSVIPLDAHYVKLVRNPALPRVTK